MNGTKKIGFVGLGLIGGSIAKAVRQYFPDSKIVAFDKNEETLSQALREGVINEGHKGIDHHFSGCDYIFLCTPVGYNTAYLKELTPYLHKGCILTDVGSVKTSIHEEVISLGLEEYFIGGHPMAGSEKSGYVSAKPVLIENAYFILTPSEKVAKERIDAYSEFVRALKALPVVLTYQEHDYITGVISHLPHIIAATLVNFVKGSDSERELMKRLAAGGFKDITRIASSSPTMWQHICLKNKDNIVRILEKYISMLEDAKKLVESGNEEGIYELFDSSRSYRNSILDASPGPIKRVFAIYCDIQDETGGISGVATVLANNDINLKNIGIIHNREFEEGVLRIEFYEEGSSRKACSVLAAEGYTVYER